MKNNKKSLIIISTYDDIKNPFYGGGGAIAIHELAKRICCKYSIRILSWNHSGKTRENIDGVDYERFGLKFLHPKLSMLVFQLALPLIIIFKKYDLWLESFSPPLTTSFLPLFTKNTVVCVVHMLAAEDMQRKYKLPFHLIENIGIKKYKNIIVTSKSLKEKVLRINSKCSVAVISNGVDKVNNRKFSYKNYILFLGRIEINQKGIDLLIPAFKKFNEEKKYAYKLIIAGFGDPKELKKLKQIVDKFDIDKYVIFEGRVSGRKKETLLNYAACAVIPSRFETYSLVGLEAMAHGLPIVCFDIKGLSWIPGKAAKKVRAFDTDKLSKAISQVVSDPLLRNYMKIEGIKYARKFTWNSISKLYDDYIRHVTAGL